MPLLYIPLDISKCCNYLGIQNSKYVNKYIYNKFSEFYDDKFCPYEIINKNTKYICGNKIKDGSSYCKKHNKNNNVNKKQVFYCIAKSCRRTSCGRKVKGPNQLCVFHNKSHKNNPQNDNYDDKKNKFKDEITNIINKGINTNSLYDIIDKQKRKRMNLNKFKFTCLYLMYNRKRQINVKNNINEIIKYSFNTNELYKIVENIKNRNENFGNKSYYHYICKNTNIIEISRKLHKNNMQLIIYKDNNLESFNSYMNNKYKKYLKNKKKNEKKKNKFPEIKKEEKIIEKVNYEENELILKDIKNFISKEISLKIINDDIKLEQLKLIVNFIDSIKYNKYFKFYCNFIKTNIYKLLNLSNASNIICHDYKYKNVIIFNRNKDINLKKILLDIDFEIYEIPQKTISWFGNKNGLYDYTNKYNIDLDSKGIKIYKKEDISKKHKLNIDQLIVFYC